ncbi:MAG: nickel pincer cofactor biosynthesis protein LarC [Eubacteriales bacterium]|nr:nickel pincer cofactor biosynthesis protein LarC [Eubacteriales bacterium]
MKETTLYLECNSGISGDMTVAALLDLGADEAVLESVLNSLPIGGFHVEISKVKKAGLEVCDFNVVLEHTNCDHDMEFLHGHNESHVHSNSHEHVHEHRNLEDIKKIIAAGVMTDGAKMLAFKIFDILAAAEAKAHGVFVEQVHFHEVGAVDSIIDIVAAAVCIDNLGITECVVPVLCDGSGSIRCQHGIMPVPVPAVVNIAASHGLNLSIMPLEGEFVTPTGAAIVAAVKTTEKLPKTFKIEKTGLGGGKREYEKPSILRAMIIAADESEDAAVWKLESNIDDSTGEELGYCMECLFKAGAGDVNYQPVFMKKNRPAYQLNVICEKEKIPKMEEIIFNQTTTIGIRKMQMERTKLKRREITIMTDVGSAQVKVCEYGDKSFFYPEYESVIKLCQKLGMSYREAYNRIVKAASNDNKI